MTPRARLACRPSFGVSGDFLDFLDEEDGRAAEAQRKRDAGNFDPYFVRRPPRWTCILFPRWRWTIYHVTSDMGSAAPDYYALPYFWRLKTACKVAVRLQEARGE